MEKQTGFWGGGGWVRSNGFRVHNIFMKVEVRLYQDEDQVWIAEVPSIPGCGSDGKTREEAIENVKDAVQACVAVRKELGLPTVVETISIEVAA